LIAENTAEMLLIVGLEALAEKATAKTFDYQLTHEEATAAMRRTSEL
jgi:hypothetical protein